MAFVLGEGTDVAKFAPTFAYTLAVVAAGYLV